jgi:hypothetical protein
VRGVEQRDEEVVGRVADPLRVVGAEELGGNADDRAFVGTRTRIFSITGSWADVPESGGRPGELGTAPPLAAYQSAGKPLDVPTFSPGWNASNPGWPGAAAAPVERIAKALPADGTFAPKLVRIARDCVPGVPVPSREGAGLR